MYYTLVRSLYAIASHKATAAYPRTYFNTLKDTVTWAASPASLAPNLCYSADFALRAATRGRAAGLPDQFLARANMPRIRSGVCAALAVDVGRCLPPPYNKHPTQGKETGKEI